MELSSLQMGLGVAGALVLVAVVAQGAWAARKSQPRRARTEAEGQPAGATGPGQHAAAAHALPERLEPQFDTADDDGRSMVSLNTLTTPEKRTGLDTLIDVIAPVQIESVISGEAALAAMPGSRRAGSKPFAIEGLNAVSGEWEFPSTGQRYTAFQCGVQLANRLGGLNQIEYSEFVMKAQAFADAIGAEAEFPEMLDEVARARELDHFASAHDAQLSFTLRAAQTAWSPGYVHQSAAQIGFVPGSIPGRMVLPAASHGSAPLLGLAFDKQAAMADDPEQSALREITLSLDVPQVPREEHPFARLCEAALTLARSMDGVVIDDNGNPIQDEAMDGIAAELEKLYDTLDARDLSAGSALGRRLFS